MIAGDPLDAGWSVALCASAICLDAAAAQKDLDWIETPQVGPAQALLAGAPLPDGAATLHDCDVWYRTRLDRAGRFTLVFEGLATLCEIWIDGRSVATSHNMFRPLEISLDLRGGERLVLVCRSLSRHLADVKGPRARWRVPMIVDQNLRFVRTTLLGHMPGWCPPVAVVGLWRPVRLVPAATLRPCNLRIVATPKGDDGLLDVSFDAQDWLDHSVVLRCHDAAVQMLHRDGRLYGTLTVRTIDRWWPHTHGAPTLYDVLLEVDGDVRCLARTGFRYVTIDKGEGRDMRFVVNGISVFARGLCWTPPDVTGFVTTSDVYRRELTLARDAGVNLLRICGTTVYEPPAFHDLADELGIMVWQDAMLANFDYPAEDDAFRSEIMAETQAVLEAHQGSPSLVAYCGGSEILQQAAMMGLPAHRWHNRVLDAGLPTLVAALRPDIAWIVNSPSDGDLPFFVDEGVGHYYGVGAYCRPLDDARRADVAFAGECLAFSHLPSTVGLAQMGVDAATPPERWASLVPRDRGADWDFEDVTHHYMALLYGVDPPVLKAADFERYGAVSRAAVVTVMEFVFAEWRRPASRTGGALVLMWKDLAPCFGWGVVEHCGRPKPAYYGLKRAFRPLLVSLSDEGVNGLHVHVVNETPHSIDAELSIECLRDGHICVVSGSETLSIASHSGLSRSAINLIGAFFDTNWAYRFGPPGHDVTVARLRDVATGEILGEAFHLPLGHARPCEDIGLVARVEAGDEGMALIVTCQRFAQMVAIDDAGWRPHDNYFHLAPGQERRIELTAIPPNAAPPRGCVSTLNGLAPTAY